MVISDNSSVNLDRNESAYEFDETRTIDMNVSIEGNPVQEIMEDNLN